MGDISQGAALKFIPNQREIVQKLYDLDKPQRLNEALNLMKDWIKKQQHFKRKDFSDEYLERLIINNKGSIEKSKVRLDKLCTLKTLWADFFASIDVHCCEKYFKYYNILALPEPTEELWRVLIFKTFPISPLYPDVMTEILKYSAIVAEYLKINEYVDGFIIIYDVRNCDSIELLSVATLNQLRRVKTLYVDGYGLRVKYFHIVTTSSMSDILITLAKQVVSKKVGERLHAHTTLDSLHKFVSKKILPAELGGEAGPMEKIRDTFHRELCNKEYTEYLKDVVTASTDESKRSKDTFNETYVNMPGAFRTLVLD